MNLVEIFVNNERLDLYDDADIKFTFQVNDIADVKDRQANYTNSFSIPKTANNVRIFGGLGIHSDTSDIPYQKPNCRMKIQGFDLITNGWLNVSETSDDEYKIYVYSGVINFFKAIENKTLGNIVELETEHRKNTANVIGSFHNETFKYLIADYNGNTHFDRDGHKVINIDHLVPSVSVKYLWDKIHQNSGFYYEGTIFSNEDFTNLWLTYPKYISIEDFKEEANVITQKVDNWHYHYYKNRIPLFLYGLEENKFFIIKELATYKISVSIVDNSENTSNFNNQTPQEVILVLHSREKGDFELGRFQPSYANGWSYVLSQVFEVGDELSLFLIVDGIRGIKQADIRFNVKFEKNNTLVNVANELKDFAVKDFVKEIINRFGLTMFVDEYSKKVRYMTLKERIKTAQKVDWTHKYIERNREKYVNSFYAQKNNFKFQYNDKGGEYNNAFIGVNNENIPESKDLFQSKIYSPEKEKLEFDIGSEGKIYTDTFKFYEKEVNEQKGIKYKGLEKRFYLLKEKNIQTQAYIGSVSFREKTQVQNIPLGVFDGTSWRYYLNAYYRDFGKIINHFRLHQIELNLSLTDVLNLDFNALYYFQQEQQYYLLNKLSSGNDRHTAEFVAVRIADDERTSTIIDVPTIPDEPVNPSIEIAFADDATADKIQTESSIGIVVKSEKYNSANSPVIKYWQVFNPKTEWDIANQPFKNIDSYTHSPYTWQNLVIGDQSIRLRAILKDGTEIYSNVLRVARLSKNLPNTPRKFSYHIDNEKGAEFLIINKDKQIEWLIFEGDNRPNYGSNNTSIVEFLAYTVIIANVN